MPSGSRRKARVLLKRPGTNDQTPRKGWWTALIATAVLAAARPSIASADDGPKGEIFVRENQIKTRVEVSQQRSDNGYAVNIRGSVAAPGQPGTAAQPPSDSQPAPGGSSSSE